jgi:hypothetical protein
VNGSDIFFIGVVPDFALWVGVSRFTKIDEVSRAADVDQLALRAIRSRFLASDDGGHEIACERAAGIDGDVVFFAEGADFLDIIEVTDNDAIGLEGGFELIFWFGAADVCCHWPIWVHLLDGFYVGRLKMSS